MRSRLGNRCFFFTCFLVLFIATGTIGALFPPSREGQQTPVVVRANPAPSISTEQARLLGDLREAKRAGDPGRVLTLEQQLAELRGKPLQLGAPSVGQADEVEVTYHGPGELLADVRWQGNDILVAGTTSAEIKPALASDSAGNLYAAFEYGDPGDLRAHIYRSTDGGETWSGFFTLSGTLDISNVSLAVGEGVENLLLMAMEYGDRQIRVFRVDLDDPLTYDLVTVYDAVTSYVATPRIVTDGAEYNAWYAYVTFNLLGVEGWMVMHSRSTDYGVSWTSPLDLIDQYSTYWSSGDLSPPDIAFGSGHLFLTYCNAVNPGTDDLREIFVSRSTDFGATWGAPVQLTSNDDADYEPAVAVVRDYPSAVTAVVAYTRYYDEEDLDVWHVYTQDGGDTWFSPYCLRCFVGQDERAPGLATSFSAGSVHAAVWHDGAIDFASTAHTSPTSWTYNPHINYGEYASGNHPRPAVAVNPTLPVADEAGIVWTDDRNGHDDIYYDGPVTVGLGTVIVDTQPDGLDPPWTLSGPEDYFLAGSGDITLTDMNDGDWTITWGDGGSDWAIPLPSPVTENLVEGGSITFTGEYGFIPPVIASIVDVDNDQGRNVRLTWNRSCHDAPGEPVTITGYDVFRRQDAYKAAGDQRLEGWDSLDWIAAHGDETYDYVAPTLCDSTAEGGICWSVFMVRATTADPFTFWDSAPDSGYSVDNLFPNVPTGLHLPNANLLAWDPSPDDDFRYFSVYTSATEDFLVYSLVDHTTATSLDVTGTEGDYLAVTATDFAGNQSDLSVIVRNLTAVPDGGLPTSFALHSCVPNPFNPMTTIRFDLPAPASVSLAIYAVDGRRVAVLVDGPKTAGRHQIRWFGQDDQGRKLASGVYFCRLMAGDFRETRQMVLLK